MTAYPAWTPAARPGIIPLRPLTFGTILGRSFMALRQNPRVMLGFALVVQSVATFLGAAAIAGITVAVFLRLDTVRPGTREFDEVLAGSIAITAIAAVVITLALGTLSVLVQGIVVSEVAHAAVAEKMTLGALWRRVKPAAWRLIGYTAALTLAVLVVVGLVAVAIVTLILTAALAGLALAIGAVLAAIPVALWLSVKLLLVPSAIVLERQTIGAAVVRSWVLTRGRFWPALGVVVIITVVFGTIGQVVGLPVSLASTAFSTVLSPTGDPEVAAIVTIVVGAVLTQIVTVLVQAVALIVQSTAAALVYIDCRMRREGLDLDLLAYTERRDAGDADQPDPYRLHVGRVIVPRAPQHPGWPVGYAHAQPGHPPAQPGYPSSQPGYLSSQAGHASAQPEHPPAPQWPAPGQAGPGPVTPGTPSAAEDAAPTPAGTTDWTAPGAAPAERTQQ